MHWYGTITPCKPVERLLKECYMGTFSANTARHFFGSRTYPIYLGRYVLNSPAQLLGRQSGECVATSPCLPYLGTYCVGRYMIAPLPCPCPTRTPKNCMSAGPSSVNSGHYGASVMLECQMAWYIMPFHVVRYHSTWPSYLGGRAERPDR